MKVTSVILFSLIPGLCMSQTNTGDSLKKQLTFLKDTSRVNCLNQISVFYYINALNETYENVQTDSAILYASLAYKESENIHYKKGIAEALQNLGEIARDRLEYVSAERYFRRSIPLFEEIHVNDKYSWANVTLGWSLHVQGKFTEAKTVYERAMPYYVSTNNKERQSMLDRLISYTYSARGYNEKAFEYMLKAIRITNRISDTRGVISSPQSMGILYRDAGDSEKALTYFHWQQRMQRHPTPYDIII